MNPLSNPIKQMRIAHVTATFPPYLGGAGTVCYHNARQLALRGHEVHVFTAAMNGAPPEEVMDGFTVRRLPALLRVGNMPVVPTLTSALKGYDVIHLHYPFILGAELVSLAAALNHTPLVVSFHNDLIGAGPRAAIFRVYQSLSAQVSVRRAARLCVLSFDHYESSRLGSSLAASNIQTVELPNGVDVDHFAPLGERSYHEDGLLRKQHGIPDDARVVLFVAAMDTAHHFKGLPDLLQAMRLLPENTWLVAVGDGDLREEYESQAAQLGIAHRVVFAGAINHDRLPLYYQTAAVTVLPSWQTESFGLVLVESLACGTPVVATRLPGVRVVVDEGQNGLLVERRCPDQLAAAIRQITEDRDLRAAMSRHGREAVCSKYGWDSIGARLENIYGDVQPPRAKGHH